ncbi:MAG TPA: glycosyltransferase [Lachnospiraceae bacterium]|nr:glycosyltransferase [Lachnospiraceae bacterium]
MVNEMVAVMDKISEYVKKLSDALDTGKMSAEEFRDNASELMPILEALMTEVPHDIIVSYKDFFESFKVFCKKCNQTDFLIENVDNMASSLELFGECVEQIKKEYNDMYRTCTCCGSYVTYSPLPSLYKGITGMEPKFTFETINKKEYFCPSCQSTDRDRLLISFLKKIGLEQAGDSLKLLQFAPSIPVEKWLLENCPQVSYESTDLYMEDVTFTADIQDLNMVSDATYDIVICSHVLEHVRDDKKALSEMKRILKPEGMILFLVPVDLKTDIIEEEWGLSEEENWKRFGQGDHCRLYGKKALVERLAEHFYVNELSKDYFGENIFHMGGFSETSTLYVLTKDIDVKLDVADHTKVDEELCKNGPLVSVIMCCYNHEKYVAEAIESVLNQSYQNIEFLVADDGSSDHSVDIMKQYSKHFAKEFYFDENTGSRFQLLKENATGKYTALMNSDDVWDKDKIALQVAYMEAHQECGACFTWCLFTDENLNQIHDNTFIRGNMSSYEWMHYFWTQGNVLCNPSSLIPTKINKQIPLYGTACWQIPDFFKWVNMVQSHTIHIMTKPLIYMRQTGRNASKSTKLNWYRHTVEEASNWMWIIRNMESSFFKKAFSSLMIDTEASSDIEIKCEKYFLLLHHHSLLVQNSAFCYFSEIYNDVKDCMFEKYQYGVKEFKEDCASKGLASRFL